MGKAIAEEERKMVAPVRERGLKLLLPLGSLIAVAVAPVRERGLKLICLCFIKRLLLSLP